MILIIALIGSLVTAVGIGYLGVAADQGIKAVAESKVGIKVGKWLFLYPLFDFLDRFLSEIVPRVIQWVVNAVGYGVALVAIVIAICALLAVAGFFAGILVSILMLIFSFMARHLNWMLFIATAITAVVYLVRRS